jgi:hypothetical protein
VLAAVDARRQRPWYAQPWSTWPPLHQACVVTACLLLLVAATTFAMPVLLARVSSDIAATSVGPIAAMVDAARAASRVISTVTTLAATIAALWRALCGPLVVYASVVLAAARRVARRSWHGTPSPRLPEGLLLMNLRFRSVLALLLLVAAARLPAVAAAQQPDAAAPVERVAPQDPEPPLGPVDQFDYDGPRPSPVLRVGADFTLNAADEAREVVIVSGRSQIAGHVHGDLVVIFGDCRIADTPRSTDR